MCVSVACTIYGVSVTHLVMVTPHPEIMQMLGKSESKVIHNCKFQNAIKFHILKIYSVISC